MPQHRKPRLRRQGRRSNPLPTFRRPEPAKVTAQVNAKPRGRQFFNNPGPTNIPDRVLRAMDRPVMDFLAPEFLEIQRVCTAGIKRIFKTDQELFFHASTGHGAWEAAVANLFSPGELVLVIETGYFSLGFKELAETIGLRVEMVPADWRKGVDVAKVAERLAALPGSKTYGIPSVKARWFGEVKLAGHIGRNVFWPAPNVDSGLVAFTRTDQSRADVTQREVFPIIDAAFAQRRKTLRSALAGWAGSAARAEDLLIKAGIDPQARGEQCDISDFANLAMAAKS